LLLVGRQLAYRLSPHRGVGVAPSGPQSRDQIHRRPVPSAGTISTDPRVVLSMECPVKIPRTGIARGGSPGTLRRPRMRSSSAVRATLFLLVGVATAQLPSPQIQGPITGPGTPFLDPTRFDLPS